MRTALAAAAGAALSALLLTALHHSAPSPQTQTQTQTQTLTQTLTGTGTGTGTGTTTGTTTTMTTATPPPALDGNTPATCSAQLTELTRLRDRLHDLESQLASARSGAAGSFFSPTHDDLLQMARECKLRWDTPSLGLEPPRLGPRRAVELGLGDDDVQQVNRVAADTNARVVAELRQLYVEVTGDRAGADTLTPQTLENEILAKSPEGVGQQVFWRLSQERAGLLKPPGDGAAASPLERMMRMLTGLGDRYEHDLGAALGADRAHQLRARDGGWNSRSSSSLGCPDQR